MMNLSPSRPRIVMKWPELPRFESRTPAIEGIGHGLLGVNRNSTLTPFRRSVLARYQFSVPLRQVRDCCAISFSEAGLPSSRKSVAAQAGPQEDSEVWRHTPSDQRS